MINRVILTGRPTKKPILRHTSSGIAVAQCTLAVDRQYANSQGARQADFISLVLWRKSAENFVKYVDKGQLIGIDGRLQTRTYDNKDGQKVYATEVVVDQFAFLGSNRNDSSSGGNNQNTGSDSNNNQTTASTPTKQNNPANNQTTNTNASNSNNTSASSDPFSGTDSIDISDDDLPF